MDHRGLLHSLRTWIRKAPEAFLLDRLKISPQLPGLKSRNFLVMINSRMEKIHSKLFSTLQDASILFMPVISPQQKLLLELFQVMENQVSGWLISHAAD